MCVKIYVYINVTKSTFATFATFATFNNTKAVDSGGIYGFHNHFN